MQLWDGKGTVVPTGFKIASLNTEYEITKLINDGASVAYFALRLTDKRKVFLKHFKDPNKLQGKAYTDFINHQKKVFVKLKNLTSGKSVKITEGNYEFFEYAGCHFQAKEPIDGVSLNDFLYEDGKSKKIPFVTRLMIAKQMLEILHEIHQHGIIHSDLKPQQIMLSEDSSVPGGQRVTLIDFDHAILVEADGTKIGDGAGTDTWFSPEHADNLPKEFATDVFTMSLMISDTMGAGHPYAEHIDDYGQAILKQKAKRLCDVIKNDKLITIDEILFRSLHPKHKERPSVMEMLDVINTFLSTGGKKTQASPVVMTCEYCSGSYTALQSGQWCPLCGEDCSSVDDNVSTKKDDIKPCLLPWEEDDNASTTTDSSFATSEGRLAFLESFFNK